MAEIPQMNPRYKNLGQYAADPYTESIIEKHGGHNVELIDVEELSDRKIFKIRAEFSLSNIDGDGLNISSSFIIKAVLSGGKLHIPAIEYTLKRSAVYFYSYEREPDKILILHPPHSEIEIQIDTSRDIDKQARWCALASARDMVHIATRIATLLYYE